MTRMGRRMPTKHTNHTIRDAYFRFLRLFGCLVGKQICVLYIVHP
jgi:hypothetical protein